MRLCHVGLHIYAQHNQRDTQFALPEVLDRVFEPEDVAGRQTVLAFKCPLPIRSKGTSAARPKTDGRDDKAIAAYVDEVQKKFDPTSNPEVTLPLDDVLQWDLESEWKFRTETGINTPMVSLVSWLYKRKADRGEPFVTVQVGAHNGHSNDLVYKTLARKFNHKQMGGASPKWWRAIAIEPTARNYAGLTKNYQEFVAKHGLSAHHFQMVRGAVALPEHIDAQHKCHFYSLNLWAKGCHGYKDPKLKSFDQIGKLDRKGLLLKHTDMKKDATLKNPECLTDDVVDCWTTHEFVQAFLPKFLPQKGFGPTDRAPIDMLFVDTEGFDFNVIRMLLDGITTTPGSSDDDGSTRLWPAVIFFEIKILNPPVDYCGCVHYYSCSDSH